MSKSIEELTAEVVVAVINANPDTTPLVKLIKDVHETLRNLKQSNTV